MKSWEIQSQEKTHLQKLEEASIISHLVKAPAWAALQLIISSSQEEEEVLAFQTKRWMIL